METIRLKISRELAERYATLHEATISGSTNSMSLEDFTAAFVEERLTEEIQFLENELKLPR